MTDHSEELDALVDQLEAAGLVERCANSDGKAAMRLTPEGEQLSMLGEDGQDALMDALLETREA